MNERGVIDLLSARGAKSYVLEVIETNARAAALYRDVGFEERRRFQCWTFEASALREGGPAARHPPPRELANANLDTLAAWSDIEPSWQNTLASIRRAPEPYVVLGDDRGAAIVFPRSGDLALLAVRGDARRQGIGSQLLTGCAARAAKALKILNIDDRDAGIAAFMAAAGAKPLVRQIEMIRPLR